MKIRTVGFFAAAAMTLTSLSVWSLTPPGGLGERLERAAEAAMPDALADAALGEAWRFSDGDTLQVEARLGHSAVAADRDTETFLYVNVTGRADAVATKQAPVHAAVVIDRSGSMSGKRLRNAIAGARGMVQQLRNGDRISLITYSDSAETLVRAVVISDDTRALVGKQLDRIVPSGDTCISCGIEAATDALRSSPAGTIKRVLLLSDGEATAGVRDTAAFGRLAERARDMGCSITSVGVDVDYNERIMSTIARRSNGRHYFVENPADLSQVFEKERQSLVRTVASNGEMRIELAPGVQLLQVFDRAFRREGNTLVVPMGTFAAAENKTVLLKVRVPRGAEGVRSVARINLGFEDLVKGKRDSCKGQLATALTNNATRLSPLDPLVASRVQRSLTSAALKDANGLFKRGDVAGANRLLQEKRKSLATKQARLAAAAPKPRRQEVESDLNAQLKALDQPFAAPPPGAPPAQQSRPGKTSVRNNSAASDAFAF